MNQLIYLQETLQKQYRLLCHFEEATQEMLFCPVERLEELVLKRQELLDEIDALSRELDSRFEGDTAYRALTNVLEGEMDASLLPEELQEAYTAGMRIRTVLSRLRESDMQATLRLRTEQEIILKQIKAVNQGHSAKAARFFSGPGGGSSRLGNA